MDKVFEEEKQNLQITENQIDLLINKHRNASKSIQKELSDFNAVDYDDVDEKRYLRQKYQFELEQVSNYEKYKSSPYFGRLDFQPEDNEYKTETFYIGKKGLTVGKNIIITDWRAPIGEFFYDKTEKEFKHEQYLYTLLLRRALQIENAQLHSYNTEFDGDDVSLEGDIIDPFLLTVLKDKRRQNRLTDIIKTIQGNQNAIIRKPSNESFVVQGCAGSGKTMILLHRLSYLAYNKRYSSYTHIKIITPNKFFNLHIDDLSSELGLGDVERLTVEEFYVSLIKKYSDKINIDANVISEKNISEVLLTELYSVEFQEKLNRDYHIYWDNIISDLKKDGLFEILTKYSKFRVANIEHNISNYELLSTALNNVLNYYKSSQIKLSDKTDRTQNLISQISMSESKYESKHSEIVDAKNDLLSNIGELSLRYNTEIEALGRDITQIDKQINEFKLSVIQIDTITKKNTKLINEIDNIANGQIDISTINNSELINFLNVSCKTKIDELSKLNDELKKIPVYNFARRNKVKKIIQELNNEVSIVAKEKLFEYRIYIVQRTDDFSVQVAENQKNLTCLKTKKETLTKKIKEIELGNIVCTSIKKAFETYEYPDLKHVLSSKDFTKYQEIINGYVQVYTDFIVLNKRIISLKEQLRITKSEIEEINSKLPSYIEIECIRKHQTEVELLSANTLYKNIFFKEMRSLYKKNNTKYTKDNYRHKIYLKLIFCSLYYKKAIGLPTFLNIDEAQDLALTEYRLLKTILGDSCIFNLYGDVNQLVYSYKGISDWEDINDVISGNIYFLNENYRNTIQITDYCNKEFEADIFPIGISGKAVHELSIEDAIKNILNIKQNSPQLRCAIIFRYGINSIEDKLKTAIPIEFASWYQINDSRISIVSVEAAKGLEFDAVVVIADQMTPNEKYIAYTRALDELIVVNDSFEPNKVDEYIEYENIIDDNII